MYAAFYLNQRKHQKQMFGIGSVTSICNDRRSKRSTRTVPGAGCYLDFLVCASWGTVLHTFWHIIDRFPLSYHNLDAYLYIH